MFKSEKDFAIFCQQIWANKNGLFKKYNYLLHMYKNMEKNGL